MFGYIRKFMVENTITEIRMEFIRTNWKKSLKIKLKPAVEKVIKTVKSRVINMANNVGKMSESHSKIRFSLLTEDLEDEH